MPLFSVVIPVFNRASIVGRTLDSVAAQTFRDFEVIVVDDGSSDDTCKVVASRPERLNLISISNSGPGRARNVGIGAAKGEYVAFLDSDDQWAPWTLQVYAEVIESKAKPNFICGRFADTADSNYLGLTAPDTDVNVELYSNFLSANVNPITDFLPSSVAVSRMELERVGGFATQLSNWEDVDLFLRLGKTQGFARINTPLCTFRDVRFDSLTRSTGGDSHGADHLFKTEKARAYPDGSRTKVAEYLRAISVTLVRNGQVAEAWAIYKKTLRWHLQMGRLKYVFGFPVFALVGNR